MHAIREHWASSMRHRAREPVLPRCRCACGSRAQGTLRADGNGHSRRVRIFGPAARPETGVVSFRIDGVDVALTGILLDASYGIAVRTGRRASMRSLPFANVTPLPSLAAWVEFRRWFEARCVACTSFL